MRFFDTNILVYAATNQERQKGDIARELIQHALEVNHDGVISVQVMSSTDSWFGVTYREDKPVVQQSIRNLIASGKYPTPLE